MADKLPVGDTIDNLKTDGQKLVQDSKALVTAEIKPAAKHAGIGAGMFGGAGYFGIVGALLLWLCGAFAFSLMWQHIGDWSILLSLIVGFATMAVAMFILAGIFALVGKGQISRIKAPTGVIDEAKSTLEAVKSAIARGKYNATARSSIDANKVSSDASPRRVSGTADTRH
ncbi:phage holin family protein [Cutibacterium sp.]|uniref:phage holin family protein n=1 Tax=Cutibacterium sp. TaxID=1912221 RepID=UPI0026DAC1D0|nr:phage holin family protein [Cutibacterium sp.]MDO4412719.1 phage holin family protein [Cutibacterium sp.]